MVDAAAAADGVLLQGAQAGQGLAGVEDAGGRALERVDPVRRRGRDAGEVQARLRAVRSATSSPLGRAGDAHDDVALRDAGAVGHAVGDRRRRRPSMKNATAATPSPATTPGLAGGEDRLAAGVGRDGRGAGRVVRRGVGQVLAHSARDQVPDVVGVEAGGGRARRGARAGTSSRLVMPSRDAPRWRGRSRARRSTRPGRRRRRATSRCGRPSRRRGRGSPRASGSRGSRCAARPPRPARC